MRDQSQCLAEVHAILRDELPKGRQPRVLEAGGGSFSHITLERDAHIAVIDISAEQLERNSYADDLILGDLEDPNAIRGEHDLIVCFDVLEHLRRPQLALKHMTAALADGGLIVIGCPNRSSTKGLITRYTPHGFHVWYYKSIRGIPDAGQPGHAPFETFLGAEMDFDSVQAQLKRQGLEIAMARRYEGPAPRELKARHPLLYSLYALPAAVGRALGQAPEQLAATDWIIVARRPAQAMAQSRAEARRA